MPNKLKNSGKSRRAASEKLVSEREEKIEVKKLVKDERTKKIIGSLLLLFCFFLFVAFTSYLFTWAEDQDKVFRHGIGILKPNELEIRNLLGSFGAYIAHLFFFKGFGIASFLFCTLLFVIGTNLLFGKKIFSIRRNVKYVLVGLIVFSVSFSFVLGGQTFSWGGEAGNIMSKWLIGFIGKLGTSALLLVACLAYFIWRFNPIFHVPNLQKLNPLKSNAKPDDNSNDEARLFVDQNMGSNKGNLLKDDTEMSIIIPNDVEQADPDIKLVEKGDALLDFRKTAIGQSNESEVAKGTEKTSKRKAGNGNLSDLKLEINDSSNEDVDDNPPKLNKLPPYDPVLDLRDYKYPSIDLLDQHGSEKIIMDPAELEANKNQIINTLKNYDIAIQKILATVGPTVTLYEIVPAAGVRISRIKNLEDDIALSLSALGIRIIAPIPGKGTIGIEVPNVKKAVVNMKTLLSSEKFQQNHFSLPIALGKRIDNENFIVDLTSMPHLLMAGATGQGKSVGVNAILVSLLYKKHPSQLKFVLIDPKKVELSLYRTIERHFLAKLPGEEEAIITDTKKSCAHIECALH